MWNFILGNDQLTYLSGGSLLNRYPYPFHTESLFKANTVILSGLNPINKLIAGSSLSGFSRSIELIQQHTGMVIKISTH